MLHSSTKKLIDRLAEMTELGKLDWTETEDGNVVYSTEGYSVLLSAKKGDIIISSIEGRELERAAAADLDGAQTEDGTSYTDLFSDMLTEAVRTARGTETAISTLLAGMEPAPEPEIEPAAEPTDLVPEEDLVNEATALEVEPSEAAPIEEAEVEIEAEVEAEAEAGAEAEAEAESEDVSESSASFAGSALEDEVEIEAEPDTDVEAEVQAEPELEAAAETEPETAIAPETEIEAEPETEIEAEAETQTEPILDASESDVNEGEIEAISAAVIEETDDLEEASSEPVQVEVTAEPEGGAFDVPELEDEADASLMAIDETSDTDSLPETLDETLDETQDETSDNEASEATIDAPYASAFASPAEPEAPAEVVSADSEDSAIETPETVETADTIIAATEDEAPTETERELTDAVARLADEVNSRDTDTVGIAAAAAATVGSVALAAGPADETHEADADPQSPDESSDDSPGGIIVAPIAAMSDMSDREETEADPVMAADPGFTSDTYVPFGTVTAASEAALAETVSDSDPEGVDTAEIQTEAGLETAPVAELDTPDMIDAPAEIEPERLEAATIETPEPDDLSIERAAPDTEPLPEPEPMVATDMMTDMATGSDLAADVSEEIEPAETVEAAPEAATGSPRDFTSAFGAFMSESPKSEPEMAEAEAAAEAIIPETEELVEASAETETLEPVASLAAEPETVIEAPQPETGPETELETAPETEVGAAERTYSLSGIGAGFGLGALTAKTEASGIPGPSAFADAQPEKIVIDATDDVLPEIEGESSLPALEPVTADAGISFSSAPGTGETMTKPSPAPAKDAETDILKPKTRFNPWD